MIYDVLFTRSEYGNVQVEAKSRKEAREKAYEAIAEGQAEWGDEDTFINSIKEFDKEGNLL
jgi:hypothetical protein